MNRIDPVCVSLIVIAKAPVAGRAKTRLIPDLGADGAAAIAAACLTDTLTAVAATPAARRVLALEGKPGSWLPEGFDVIPQRAGGLDQRLAGAFEDSGATPALLVGMDTPQITPELLGASAAELAGGCDAVIGGAPDGGYWAIGLRRADPRAFDGVPMSQPDTGRHQRAALDRLGLRVRTLRTLRDVDDHADAVAVAAEAPTTRFARALAELGPLPSSRDATGSPTRSPTTGTESRR